MIALEETNVRYSDLHNNSCCPPSSKIPIASCLQPTDDTSSADNDTSYATNITSSTNAEGKEHKDQFDVADGSAKTHQVAKVLSPPVTDRKTSVVRKEECDTEASTSPFLATVA